MTLLIWQDDMDTGIDIIDGLGECIVRQLLEPTTQEICTVIDYRGGYAVEFRGQRTSYKPHGLPAELAKALNFGA